MSLSTQLTRLARNVGALTADTNAIFEALRAKGVNVPANAQLSDVADLIESINPPHQNEVEIGGIWYPYVQIGELLWITQNLRNPTEHSWNPQYPSEINGKLYKPYYFSEIQELLPNGWRIPSQSDTNTLKSISMASNDYIIEELGGTNLTGFSAPLPGYINSSGSFTASNSSCLIWTTNKSGDTNGVNIDISKNYDVNFSDWSFGNIDTLANTCLSVRVCKDVT